MKYLSVCSGIEAATVAWHSIGWSPVAFSEIEKFPSQVLAHHYPSVPNVGDMTKFKEWDLGAIDLLIGGTPCQSFSVAGLRKGLDDPRGNLMLTYLAIAEQFKPKWLVWENVPGVLSSNGGKDFGSLLGGLEELGYGFAYRVLDAQYFGVAQRRRRVFVVGCLGDWRAAAAVLFERDSMCGNPAPKREAGKSVAGTIGARTGLSSGAQDAACGHMITAFDRQSSGEYGTAPVASTMSARDYKGASDLVLSFQPGNLSRGAGSSPSADCFPTLKADHGRGISDQFPCVAVIHGTQDPCVSDVAFALGRNSGQENAIAFVQNSRDEVRLMGGDGQIVGALAANAGAKQQCYVAQQHAQVRRLTPRECERLQGFPDDYTLIPSGKKMAADGPRYKALGNSMAVPVMHWIGSRIAEVEAITSKVAA